MAQRESSELSGARLRELHPAAQVIFTHQWLAVLNILHNEILRGVLEG